jgi:hypothetical protein
MGNKVVVLWIVAGVLIGGTYSLYKQELPKVAVGVTGLLAALALVGAVLWQF